MGRQAGRGRIVPERNAFADMPPSLLVSATYDGKQRCAVLKFYDPKEQKIVHWNDESGHLPYCYSKLGVSDLGDVAVRDDIEGIDAVELEDLLRHKRVTVSKIRAKDPLAIGGSVGRSLRNTMQTWESDIKYYETYLYDNEYVVGRYYEIAGRTVKRHDMEVPAGTRDALRQMLGGAAEGMADKEGFARYVEQWADLLSQPIPAIRRASVDIEVEAEEGRIPDPKLAEKRITAVGFAGTGGLARILVLRTGAEEGAAEPGVEPEFYDDEKKMIQDAFAVMADMPFLLTYNGDDFDLPYLFNRARVLKIPDAENPLHMMKDSATLKHGVHIDLYRTLSNKSFQIYAFSHKYTDFSLNSVSKALLGKEKIDYGVPLGQLTLQQTAAYCKNDAVLTYELTSFGSDLLMNLLIAISRIGRMPVDDIARLGVSQWIRSLLYYEHRARGALIPKREELQENTADVASEAVIKDKKYRGGLVMEPVAGIHFDVTVMDFASLYPSIIKVKNLSYETVRCPHEECKSNAIPQTNHWVCTKDNGMTAMLIGSLRDLRVSYYKSLSKSPDVTEEQRQQYTVVSQALKVILNASYGVMGAEIFPLYFLPAAEATTAIGRHTIQETIKRCEEEGIEVLYGDTDSLFIKNPTEKQINTVIDQAKRDHGVDLEVDKEYRYVVLSDRKKNYLGVTKSGKVDVKGLTGKKSHTPGFIKDLFYGIVDVLPEIQTAEDFERIKTRIRDMIAEAAAQVQDRSIPLDKLAYRVMISKSPSEYTKTIPQHIRAARMLDRDVKKGDIISYIKTLGKTGVKPVELAKPSEIDPKKYLEFMESTLDQITSSMGMEFDDILGKPKQAGLDQFFWSGK